MDLPAPLTRLPEAQWRARADLHLRRVRIWTGPRRERAGRGEPHPVEDFLFTYYPYRPAWLERWHPGPGVLLEGPGADSYLRWPEYSKTPDGVVLDPRRAGKGRRAFTAWLAGLLDACASRPAHFGCFGLHEWAMVHRIAPGETRHAALPLRLPPDRIAAVVEAGPLSCTHFDAFRFFTPAARPLNRLQPTRESVPVFEQRGCLHANMDLYKWATKLAPLGPSELTADCLALAFEIRELDMRASPYDLSSLGLAPVPVETPEGRSDYERMQRAFSARADALRTRLRALCATLLACWDGDPVTPRAFPPASAQG